MKPLRVSEVRTFRAFLRGLRVPVAEPRVTTRAVGKIEVIDSRTFARDELTDLPTSVIAQLSKRLQHKITDARAGEGRPLPVKIDISNAPSSMEQRAESWRGKS